MKSRSSPEYATLPMPGSVHLAVNGRTVRVSEVLIMAFGKDRGEIRVYYVDQDPAAKRYAGWPNHHYMELDRFREWTKP